MFFYILITVLSVAAGCFVNGTYRRKLNMEAGIRIHTAERNRQELLNRILLCGIFLLLFAVSALRIGIGNDYWAYRNNFLLIAGGKTKVSYEIGFRMLVQGMQWLFGLDNYRTTFALMAFFTCLFFIKGIYDTADWFGFSLFLFLTNGFYLMSFSNVRYYFALAICIYATKFVLRKKYVPFVLWICFAAFFHKTALIIIPAYLVAYYLKWNRKTLWMIPMAAGGLLFGKPIIRWALFKIYPFYEGSMFDTGEMSLVNVAKCGAILIFGILYYRKAVADNPKARMFFNLNLFAFLLYTCGSYVPELTRICYYMVVGQIFFIPTVLQSIEDKKQKRFWLITIGLAFCCYFIMFLIKGKEPSVLILPYLTWIFT